jgi:hypothetical protein
MTDSSDPGTRTEPSVVRHPGNASGISAWVGWIVFGAIILVLLGVFQVIQGLVALFRHDFYLVAPSRLVLAVDYSSWGWAHLVLGVLAVAIGVGMLSGNPVARVAGVVLAALSAVVNLAFLAAYPIWSVLVIALDVVVIYAIVVHGRELR